MCGIVGVAGDFPAEEGAGLVCKMNQTLLHRGPDGEGHWSTNRFAFAMRRLSIIDLATGQQPMWTPDGVGIVFNGEIYNYRSLRHELEGHGYAFATRSDTEVLLNLYHCFGIAALQRLEGMFAFCLFDPRSGVVHLIRDRMGVKPLYYGAFAGRFYFASEMKAILAGLSQRPDISRTAIHHYLTLRYVPDPDCIWHGMHKLPPGHRLEYRLDGSGWHVEPYWSVHFHAEPEAQERNYVAEFRTLFLAAVEKRLLAADVPVGVFLSGGLDSSAVSAAAVALGHKAFQTFCVGFVGDPTHQDELPWARQVARHLGSQHHEVTLDQTTFLATLPQLVHATDEPLADLTAIPLYHLSLLARQHVKVVLSGEGSDEILAGYDLERSMAKLFYLGKTINFIPSSLLRGLSHLLPRYRQHLHALARGDLAALPAALPLHITRHWSEAEKMRLWRQPPSVLSSEELIRSWYHAAPGASALDRIQEVHCRSWLVENLLMKADRMSMAASLELRTPFLDHTLVEWAARLPLTWKVGDFRQGFSSKRILREFAAGLLPPAVVARPKQGFPVPVYGWLREEPMRSRAREWLLERGARLHTHFDPAMIVPVLTAARRGDMAAAHRIWILIILEEWLRVWS
ncbi:MAG: asparagine synthase (glutamine-hydrolyzing) [Magnetococcales bacterium]|nr:asparagine synthase (glutamine-hydrolyzing) [Magnetococcales bacterium]